MQILLKELTLAMSAAMYHQAALPAKDMICMARNVYFEARGENTEGQIAVAYVTLHRVEDQRFPDSVCSVVYQPDQFSWTAKQREPRNWTAYAKAMSVAVRVLNGEVPDPVDGALYYYAPKRVHPGWAEAFSKVAQIDNHLFME